MEEKKLEVLIAYTIRELVTLINSNNIKKEDIVQIVPQSEQFILLYYK